MSEPVGRPTVMTELTVKQLEEAFALGCSDIEACFYADISKQTLYNYQKEHPEFVDRKEALKKCPTFTARKTVVTDIATNSDLALKYLQNKESGEFSTKSQSEHSGGLAITKIVREVIDGDNSKD